MYGQNTCTHKLYIITLKRQKLQDIYCNGKRREEIIARRKDLQIYTAEKTVMPTQITGLLQCIKNMSTEGTVDK